MIAMSHYCEKYRCWMSADICKKRIVISKDVRNPMSSEIRNAGCHKCDYLQQGSNGKEKRVEMEEILKHRCCRCQELKPKTQFCKNKSTVLGHDYICKDCKYADAKKFREKIRMEKSKNENLSVDSSLDQQESMNRVTEPTHPVIEDAAKPETMRVEVDFSEYPDLYEYFMATCKAEFRSPNMMILYMIRYFQLDWKGFSIEQ